MKVRDRATGSATCGRSTATRSARSPRRSSATASTRCGCRSASAGPPPTRCSASRSRRRARSKIKLGTSVQVLPGRSPALRRQGVGDARRALGRARAARVRARHRAPGRAAGVRRRARRPGVDLRRGAPADPPPVDARTPSTTTARWFHYEGMTVLPKPAHPLDVWLGGKAPSELRRVGRLADGWLASASRTPGAVQGRARVAIEDAADAAGRAIDPDHFGAMVLLHARRDPRARSCRLLASRNPDADRDDLVAHGWPAVRDLCERYVAVGFSKLVLVPFTEPQLGRRARRRRAQRRAADPELSVYRPPRKRRRPIIEPSDADAGADRPAPATPITNDVVRAHVERLQQDVLVLQQVRDQPLQEVDEPDREAGADRALHESFGHERHAHEPVRRADELHHLDLAPAGERREPDRVHDQEQRRREQHRRPSMKNAQPDPLRDVEQAS